MSTLVVGVGQDRVVDHGDGELGRHRLPCGRGRSHRQHHLVSRLVALLVRGELDLEILARVAVDHPLRERREVGVEDRDAGDPLLSVHLWITSREVDGAQRLGPSPHRGHVDERLPHRGSHHHLSRVRAAHAGPHGVELALEIVVGAQHTSSCADLGQGHGRVDACGLLDHGAVAAPGHGTELEPAQTIVHAGEATDDLAQVVLDPSRDVRRAAVRIGGFDVDTRGQPLHEVAALGVEGQVHGRLDDGDRSGDGLGGAAGVGEHREQPVRPLQLVGKGKADEHLAPRIGPELQARDQLSVHLYNRLHRHIRESSTGGTRQADHRTHRVARAVGLPGEVQLLADAGRLVVVHDEDTLERVAVDRRRPQGPGAPSRIRGDVEIVGGLAHRVLHVLLGDGLPAGVDELVAHTLSAPLARQLGRAQVPGLDPDIVAGSVERPVELHVHAPCAVSLEPGGEAIRHAVRQPSQPKTVALGGSWLQRLIGSHEHAGRRLRRV